MSDSNPRILVTGASGHLGRLAVSRLVEKLPPSQIVAMARRRESVEDLAALGVEVSEADYDKPETLAAAFDGIDRLLLVSASEVGKRAPQHANVIAAAKTAGVRLIAYTSILHADTSPMKLAAEHVETERRLRDSGVPFVLLRNGWYTENYLGAIPAALQYGAVMGAEGTGRISAAARADFAEAAAAVIASNKDEAGKIYELAGDQAFTMTELAAALSELSGKQIVYKQVPEAEYAAMLAGVGIPEAFAATLADSSACAARGALFDDSRTLGKLIGRPTTPMPTVLATALAKSRP